jgi:flagellar protein FlgJ
MDPVNLHSSKHHTAPVKNAGAAAVSNSEPGDTRREEIISVARKFEALMLHTMLKSMRATIAEDELTGNDGQDLYRDMMDQEIAKNISESGGFGLQTMLARQLGANMNVAMEPADAAAEANVQTGATMIPTNGTSKAKLAQLQQYQEISSANDLMFNTQSSLMQD